MTSRRGRKIKKGTKKKVELRSGLVEEKSNGDRDYKLEKN